LRILFHVVLQAEYSRQDPGVSYVLLGDLISGQQLGGGTIGQDGVGRFLGALNGGVQIDVRRRQAGGTPPLNTPLEPENRPTNYRV